MVDLFFLSNKNIKQIIFFKITNDFYIENSKNVTDFNYYFKITQSIW